jgi:25S rRNA (uracil2634-N3)-methyltransferase
MAKKRKQLHAAVSQKPAKRPRHHDAPAKGQKVPTKKKYPGTNKSNAEPKTKPKSLHTQPEQPTIPFDPLDRILLIGEGDLSFAASLIQHHGCASVTATVLEPNLEELVAKYPHVEANIAKIKAEAGDDSDACKILYGFDAAKMRRFTEKKPGTTTVVGAMDRIIFNFPHTGGKSTDTNRQVRHNQELLVSFFKNSLPSLAPKGSIVVTLFEGEPYTLWNVRDLARHSGLKVERSFTFRADAYPGYRHARTLGAVRNRKSGEVTNSAWKGEERAARSYVFVRKDDDLPANGEMAGNKRRRGHEDDSD